MKGRLQQERGREERKETEETRERRGNGEREMCVCERVGSEQRSEERGVLETGKHYIREEMGKGEQGQREMNRRQGGKREQKKDKGETEKEERE